MDEETRRDFEIVYKKILIAKKEHAITVIGLNAVVFVIIVLYCFGINLLPMLLLFPPVGIFVGLSDYFRLNKKIEKGGLPHRALEDW